MARDLGKAAVGRDITTFTETFLKVNINLMAVGKRKKKRRFLVVTAKNRLETVFSPNKKPFQGRNGSPRIISYSLHFLPTNINAKLLCEIK